MRRILQRRAKRPRDKQRLPPESKTSKPAARRKVLKKNSGNGKSVSGLADEYREVPGLPKYRVSMRGRVESCAALVAVGNAPEWYAMQPFLSDGRRYVRLSHHGKKHDHQVAELVLRAWVGEPPVGKPHVRHINDKTNDDMLSNLEWSGHRQHRPRKPR
jgi:hypothetical protein